MMIIKIALQAIVRAVRGVKKEALKICNKQLCIGKIRIQGC
jgi:hypothetical protein